MCQRRMQGYQQVPLTETQNVQQNQPTVQPQLQPYVVPLALPQQQQFVMPSQFQYFQPPSYFGYPPVTQTVPAPPAPQLPFVNNNNQVHDTHITIRENAIDQDEKLARELQAKFDNE